MSSETINEIRKTFSIDSDDPKEIRRELIKKLASVYPTTGPFKTENDEKQYFLISGAIEKIDAEIDTSKALICVDDLRKSLGIIQENDHRKELIKVEQQKKFDKQIETSITTYRSQTFYPKVTLTTITGIVSFIWFFPSLLENHPFFKFLSTNQSSSLFFLFLTMIWLMLLVFTIQIWIITAANEYKKKEFYSKLQFETNQNELFNFFLERSEFLEDKTFLKVNFIEFLMNNAEEVILGTKSSKPYYSISFLLNIRSLFSPLMEYEIADSISDIILTKALNKGLIFKSGSIGLEDVYSIHHESI